MAKNIVSETPLENSRRVLNSAGVFSNGVKYRNHYISRIHWERLQERTVDA